MSGWSPEDAIAMERRHILEGEKMVVRQEILVRQVIEKRYDHIVHDANEVLRLLRESVDLSKDRLRDLEHRYGSVRDHQT